MDEQETKMFDFSVALVKFCTDYAKVNGLLLLERYTEFNGTELTISLKSTVSTHNVKLFTKPVEKRKVRRHNMSEENRLRAAERMRTLWASGKMRKAIE